MKVYFGTSPRTKERYLKETERVFELIKKLGHRHTSDFIYQVEPKNFYQLSPKEFNSHHRQTLKAIKEAEVCIFEASLHSLSVGYLVNYSLDLGKPVVILAQKKKVPFMFKSISSENLFLIYYSQKNLESELKKALRKAAERVDVRFNFFITPQLLSYLDWIASKKRIPRSVYLRELIGKDLAQNREYQEE